MYGPGVRQEKLDCLTNFRNYAIAMVKRGFLPLNFRPEDKDFLSGICKFYEDFAILLTFNHT